jgi:type I restriction enzyme S subunit
VSYFQHSSELPDWVRKPPPDWRTDWLKWHVRLSTQRPSDEETESLPYIANEDIASWTGQLLNSNLQPVDTDSRKFLRDDVLFNKLRPYLAKVFHAPFAGVSSGELLCLRGSDHVLPRYLFYVVSSKAFVDAINAETFGSKMPRADWETVGHQPLPLPLFETQQRIAAFLDEKTAQIDGLIENKRALLDRLAEKRQAIITQAVTKGLNPAAPMKDSGTDWLGQIPTQWGVKRLDRLNDERRPIRYGIVLPGPHFEGGVPIIKGGDVRPERLQRELLNCTDPHIDAANPRARVSVGDLVYTIRGSFGDVEIVAAALEGCNLTQDTARISPLPSVNAEWLVMALKSQTVRDHLSSGSIGATIKGINIFDLRRALLPVPPRNEQDDIATYLAKWRHELDKLRDEVLHSVNRLIEYRSALITAAVTGRIEGLH